MKFAFVITACVAAALAPAARAGDAAPPDAITQLSHMSLEQLANVEVTSVSRAAQTLSSAPASIYVITHEEIQRSGALSIPEALRLAPNLQVTQINSTDYQIGARGFGGSLESQNFSNKILILIDGRSVYNPLFSGVAYEAQDVFMDDVDRIEVISGPGATLWGSNAMNGVINIITRRAADSQGGLVRATAGNRENALAGRYGTMIGNGALRVYAKAFDRAPAELEDGTSAGDRWHKVQGGFRFDTGPSWYLMPEVFDHFYKLMGTTAEAQLDLVQLDPGYRVYAEGQAEPLDVAADVTETLETFERIEKGSALRVANYLDRARATAHHAEARPVDRWQDRAPLRREQVDHRRGCTGPCPPGAVA